MMHLLPADGRLRLALLVGMAAVTRACTVIAVTPGASVDGSTLVSHSDDAEGSGDPRPIRIAAATHLKGSHRTIYGNAGDYRKEKSIGAIPQVEHTYAYLRTCFGMMNEKQLALGETTTSSISPPNAAKPVHQGGHALLGIQELTYLVMERCATARCAVETAGALVEKYGFYQDADTPTGEAFAVGDPKEVWLFHVLPDSSAKSAVWAGARVPDGHVAALANMFTIRTMDLNDEANFLASANIEVEAAKSGRWASGSPLDFTTVFSDGEYMSKHYSGRRVWRALSLLAPHTRLPEDYGDMRTDAPYPPSLRASAVTPQKVMAIHRDYYTGTPYDLTQGLAAGPWGSPNRWSMPGAALGATWERPISIYRQDLSYVAQARGWLPDACGGLVWLGQHAAHGTVYLPLPMGMEVLPPELASFEMGAGVVDRRSAFWAFSAVQSLAESKFAWVQPEVVAMQALLEADMPAMVAAADAAYVSYADVAALAVPFAAKATLVTARWWLFFDQLLFRYADGFIHSTNGTELATPYGYPASWLKAVGYDAVPEDHGAPCFAAGTPCSSLTPPAKPLLAHITTPVLSAGHISAQLAAAKAPSAPRDEIRPDRTAPEQQLRADAAAPPATKASPGASLVQLAACTCAALAAGFTGGVAWTRRRMLASDAGRREYRSYGEYQRATGQA